MNISPFAYSLFSSLVTNSSESNILISPYSIASALSLVLAGATPGSKCENELKSVLGVNSHLDLATLSQSLVTSGKSSQSHDNHGVSLTSANGIWSKALKESYVSLLQDVHDAKAAELPATYDPINSYISNHTNGLIQNMLSGKMDPLTVGILVNAVHFKGEWTNKFDENATYPAKFTSLDGHVRDAHFMNATRNMKFATDVDLLHGASIVQLDYGKRDQDNQEWTADYAALLILPKEEGRDGINQVVSKLLEMHDPSSSAFDGILEEMDNNSHRKVKLNLPRFKMQYGTKSLVNNLRSLGMQSCLDEDEMLMGMSDDPMVHLDDVLHKAMIEVTEEGTEAAAATAGIVMTRAMPLPPPEITLDRPFVMIILHVPTKTPLFLARVDDPELVF